MSTENIYKKDFLDILFEGRNKDYGAYDLRRSADRRVRKALIGTASIALVIVGGYVLSNSVKASPTNTRIEAPVSTVLRNLPDAPIEKPAPTPPPPPATNVAPPPAVSSIRNTTPRIAPDDLVSLKDEVPHMDSIGNKAIALTTTQGDDINGVDVGSVLGLKGGNGVVEAPKGGEGSGTETFTVVEIMPSFPGGDAALMKFLRDNVRYPHMAQENGIAGLIAVQFIVDKEGSINDVKIVSAHKGGGLEEEAMRVVKKMPKWKPGRQSGQNVNVQFNLPINFQLAEN